MIHRYRDNISEAIKKLISNPVEIIAIGHHDMNRHLVYYVKSSSEEECVIKFYFKENRYNRGIFNLLKLKGFGVKVPKVLDYGILEDGVEWIKSEFIDGKILEKISANIESENLLRLYESIGEQLGKIHLDIMTQLN